MKMYPFRNKILSRILHQKDTFIQFSVPDVIRKGPHLFLIFNRQVKTSQYENIFVTFVAYVIQLAYVNWAR